VVSVTFVVVPAPDTQILGGPTGTTWQRDPQFTPTSTIPGSTFKCGVDNGSFNPCKTPYRTCPLSMGTHTISPVAVSQEGAVDLTPATRTITVANTETTMPTAWYPHSWRRKGSRRSAAAGDLIARAVCRVAPRSRPARSRQSAGSR
jgi:hypothetical protein